MKVELISKNKEGHLIAEFINCKKIEETKEEIVLTSYDNIEKRLPHEHWYCLANNIFFNFQGHE